MFLGNVNWLGYQLVFGETPAVAVIEDLSWAAGFLFLVLIEKQCDDCRAPSPPVPAAWIPVALCAGCCVFFIVSNGEPLLNVVENGLLCLVMSYHGLFNLLVAAGGAAGISAVVLPIASLALVVLVQRRQRRQASDESDSGA